MGTSKINGQATAGVVVGPHILSTVKVTNLGSKILPIAAGIKLNAGQTKTINIPTVQLQEELIPRLNKLFTSGLVTYRLIPGAPTDIAGAPEVLRFNIIGALTAASTKFPTPAGAEGATDVGGTILTKDATLRNLRANCITAPGGATTCIATVFVNGVATAITCTLSGTGTTAFDETHTVDVKKGDRVSLQLVNLAAAATANAQFAVEAY